MTEKECLLLITMEELAEVSIEASSLAQRISKALRFGMKEIQSGQYLDNEERLVNEFNDLYAMMQILAQEDIIEKNYLKPDLWNKKIDKVRKYMALSKETGQVT